MTKCRCGFGILMSNDQTNVRVLRLEFRRS